jgi:hypothetical protein
MLSADEAHDVFELAKKKAIELFGGFVPKKKSERDLPRGVSKVSTGKYESRIRWSNKNRYIGTFDTPEQASAVYMSVKKDLARANLSTLSPDKVDAAFDAARKEAEETVGYPKRNDFLQVFKRQRLESSCPRLGGVARIATLVRLILPSKPLPHLCL